MHTALRFFFHVTLGRAGFADRMARIPTPERLPVVLGTEEVALLLADVRSLKDRAKLSIAYGCGLRVSEIASLEVTDIDRATMLMPSQQAFTEQADDEREGKGSGCYCRRKRHGRGDSAATGRGRIHCRDPVFFGER
jgi:integrase